MASNPERSAKTRAALIEVARRLFAAHGFADTGTEIILEGAGVKRGALYHHFRDKADLFEAVAILLHQEGVAAIEAACAGKTSAMAMLEAGCQAWMDHMSRPDVRRVLIIDGPGVLGWQRWNEIDRQHGQALLLNGVKAASTAKPKIDPADLATLLNGAMNAAVLAADPAAPRDFARMKKSVIALLRAAFA
jgi:AcrR family transcriptional regulator